jgi:hypothetical protein
MGTAAIIDSYAMLPSATSSDISGTAGDAFGGNKNKDPVAFGNPDAMVAKAIRLQDKREAELVALRH